jgi:hypothetical protein
MEASRCGMTFKENLVSFKTEDEIKTYQGKQRLREIISSRPAMQKKPQKPKESSLG